MWKEQDVNRRSLEPHRRAPWLEEALAPSWRAHLAASLRALQEPQAAPRPSVVGAKASEVEVEVEGEGEGGDVVVDLYYCSSASRCCSKHGAQAVVDRYALLLVGFTLL